MLVALTRAVPPTLEACELTHLNREPIDLTKARAQHARYEQALQELGCSVTRLPATPDLPDSVFVEDTVVVLDELAVLTRPGAESRRREIATMREALRAHRPLAAIAAPATLDGGDVLCVERTVYVGLSRRTDAPAIDQLRALLEPLGYRVVPVSFARCLHLKTAVTQVAEGTLLLNPDWVDPSAFPGLARLEVDPAEPMAANALLVAGTLLCAAAHPRTAERLLRAGIAVLTLEASELAKAEGGLTCGSVIFRMGLEGLEPSTSRL